MNELLSKEFLESIGIVIDEGTYQALSGHYEETLNERIINEIIEELDEPQLRELQTLQVGDSQLLQQWLGATIPQLGEIIEDEIAILLGEIAENSDKLSN